MLSMDELVKAYYGKSLQSSADLKTSACCDANAVPAWLKPLLAKVHPEVCNRYYGCGLVCPEHINGFKVLDLGSGAGRDAYLLAQLVGPTGEVVGVDITSEQLSISRNYLNYHSDLFGYSNISFIEGRIENLADLGLQPQSFDLIVSNCVLNLSMDKSAVLEGVRNLLKNDGKFYFADIYADTPIPPELRNHPVLYGECLSGAFYTDEFIALSQKMGFHEPQLITQKPIIIEDNEIAAMLKGINFCSTTYQLHKNQLTH